MKKILTIGLLIALVAVGTYFYSQYKQIPSGALPLLFSRNIIVGVKIDPPFQPEGFLSPDQQKQQQDAISKNIDKVISDLEASGYSYTVPAKYTKYKYIPSFAISVSENGYRYLMKHPLVSGVEENKLSSPSSSAH